MSNSPESVLVIKSIQTRLAGLGLYRGQIDGLFGVLCQKAIVNLTNSKFPNIPLSSEFKNDFSDNFVFTFIQSTLKQVGLYTGNPDGIWGEKSNKGLNLLFGETKIENTGSKGINFNQLKLMCNKLSDDKIKSLITPLNQTFELFDINTPLRQAHFLAQVLHETSSFIYSEEIASGSSYEGRKDLGNINPGDGKLFKGRGWLQLTGRANYLKCEEFLRSHLNDNTIDITSTVSSASQVATNPFYSAMTSGYFWKFIKPKLNTSADKDDIFWVSVYVNGWGKQTNPYYPSKPLEPNNMKDRVNKLILVKKVLNIL